jgi:adenylate kinase
MLNLILFGPPGSGKGTQAALLCRRYGLDHISTGDLFRDEIKRRTPLGIKAQEFLDRGELVPDEVTIGMFSAKLDSEILNGSKGFIFDGFPRTVKQAEALDALLMTRKMRINRVLSLRVGVDELTQRILNRGKESGRSDDTSEELVRKRIAEYNSKTTPVAGFYEMHDLLSIVDGEGTIDEIFHRLCVAIEVTP